jgi:hypothetical protein
VELRFTWIGGQVRGLIDRDWTGQYERGKDMGGSTPFVMRVPTRVMWPLMLSDLREDTTRVEPGSTGARRALHSSRPALNASRVS